MNYAVRNEAIVRTKGAVFNSQFNGNCPNCNNNMTKFVSGEKHIFMCLNCGCIYLPENMQNIKLFNYKYERYSGILFPLYRKPTQAQLDYLEMLAYQTETNIDFDSITRDEAKVLIGELKEKPWTRTSKILNKFKENMENMCGNAMAEEYERNHPET